MKFIFADSLDYVDPGYQFDDDRFYPGREPYWDDQFPHEILGKSPYDGILVSRAIVGGTKVQGKYSESQAMRFRRVGARTFLRYEEQSYPESVVFGDCGAFSYHDRDVPPYSSEEMVDFYGDGQFTHGCSVDHIIFDFAEDDRINDFDHAQREENIRRFEITLKNAETFFEESKRLGPGFTPLGVVQGWSPGSMAQAALKLQQMGYTYLAIGGMAPLRAPQIAKALTAIRQSVSADMRLHILGFAKAEEIATFHKFNLTSFDTTSPLVRAFKDSNRNYYALKPGGGLEYYSAVRIPQSIENNTLKRLAKEGVYSQEDLQRRERAALEAIRDYDRDGSDLSATLDAIMNYTAPLVVGRDTDHSDKDIRKLATLRERYERTLAAAPWKECGCAICRTAGVETIIFRASNRNKRRGIHNLQAYRAHIDQIQRESRHANDADLQSYLSAAE